MLQARRQLLSVRNAVRSDFFSDIIFLKKIHLTRRNYGFRVVGPRGRGKQKKKPRTCMVPEHRSTGTTIVGSRWARTISARGTRVIRV